MKMLVDNFLNPSLGNIVVFVRTANAKSRVTLLVALLDQDFTNAHTVNGNFRNHQNTDAQHQILPMEVAVDHLLYDQFIQGRILGCFGRWVGISQKSVWKVGHAVLKMIDLGDEIVPALSGIVESDEKYIRGKSRPEKGITHKRGKGTAKQ